MSHPLCTRSAVYQAVKTRVGALQYKFKVDGQWTTSPVDAITGDGTARSPNQSHGFAARITLDRTHHQACMCTQGMFNNQRVVAPSANFHWKAAWGGAEVFVTGDFAGWAVRMRCVLCQ